MDASPEALTLTHHLVEISRLAAEGDREFQFKLLYGLVIHVALHISSIVIF